MRYLPDPRVPHRLRAAADARYYAELRAALVVRGTGPDAGPGLRCPEERRTAFRELQRARRTAARPTRGGGDHAA